MIFLFLVKLLVQIIYIRISEMFYVCLEGNNVWSCSVEFPLFIFDSLQTVFFVPSLEEV